jgi:hypothetical protein
VVGGALGLEVLGIEDGVTLGTEATEGLSERKLLGITLGAVVEFNSDTGGLESELVGDEGDVTLGTTLGTEATKGLSVG